jgi:hypothetical protein
VAQVIVTPRARQDVEEAISAYGLPEDTWTRISRSLRALERSPLAGGSLTGAKEPVRFALGPWSWMVLVYLYDESADEVYVVSIQDARSATSPSASHS